MDLTNPTKVPPNLTNTNKSQYELPIELKEEVVSYILSIK